MKKLFLLIFLISISCKTAVKIKSQSASLSCGQCQFGITAPKGWDLAVRFDDINKTYFVDGFGIDDFGDAHDKQKGFCEVIRKAKVEGMVENGRFFATSIELIE